MVAEQLKGSQHRIIHVAVTTGLCFPRVTHPPRPVDGDFTIRAVQLDGRGNAPTRVNLNIPARRFAARGEAVGVRLAGGQAGRGARGVDTYWNMASNTGQSCPPTLNRRSFSSKSSSKQFVGSTFFRKSMYLRTGAAK